MLSEVRASIQERAVFSKNQNSIRLRRIIAVAMIAMASFLSVGWTANLAIAKKIRQVKNRLLDSHQFRLLNIYNSLKASQPGFIEAMNNARVGMASWYGGMFHGRKTAMGTTYDMYAMTAAHRSLPLGTWVKVTNEQNGKSVVVQVTDRGPYVANRIMDLSYAAAQKLGYANAGTTHISMKILGDDPTLANNPALAENNSNTTPATAVTAATNITAVRCLLIIPACLALLNR